MDTKDIKIEAYNYPLPDERIAKFPKAQRDESKLLIYNKGVVSESVFRQLPDFLPSGALMVMNNTRVIQARLHFRKDTGALIEIFLLEPAQPADYEQMFQQTMSCSWLCLVGNQKKWKEGTLTREIEVKGQTIEVRATRRGEHGTSQWIDFEWSGGVSFAEILEVMGELPIPPYLNRETQESDKTTYQTVYSKIKGSVAAPTAGLHFTDRVLQAVDARGIEREEVTLHVGAGTFKPVKSATIGEHAMHTEYIAVRRHTIERLIAHGGEAIAVGTTSVRTLESLYYMGLKVLQNPDITEEELHVNQWEPYEEVRGDRLEVRGVLQALLDWLDRHELTVLHSSTQIIIAPGYDYKIVKMLITNFHQPQSTLLLLVSAFVKGDWRKIYDYALAHDFRFLSYGDSSLLIP
ncbi:MAG: S-adenosylmethionine:tRNA ribosyltransferase-isomerase [Prevotella sp.]|nr:S-adenosylmethionine:tRNA ribosyltransferase-isomerase [Prevotella sp.]